MTLDPELQRLLHQIALPLAGEAQCGVNLRDDASPNALYSQLRDARSAARAEERAADNDSEVGSLSNSHWRMVETLATNALCNHSKDIEILSWLTEGLTRSHGLLGLTVGAEAMSSLIDSFWSNGLYPPQDLDDPQSRLFAISGLSGNDRPGSLMQPLRKLALFAGEDGQPVTVWQYFRSRELVTAEPANKNKKPSKTSTASTIPSFAVLESWARTIGKPSLLRVAKDIIRARAGWRAMEAALSSVTNVEAAPATSQVGALLEEIEQIARRYIPAMEFAPTTTEAPANGTALLASGHEQGDAHVTVNSDGSGREVLVDRENLLDEILRISMLFRTREPNSPLSYTLDDAVRRARLPLPELLRELLPELSPRIHVLTGLGIRPPED